MALPTSEQNFKEPAVLKIVKTLPALGEAELGEIYLLITDGKIYVRCTSGYAYTAALTAL